MGSALKVFHIKDTENNVQVGCVHILQKSEKKNKNIFTDLELTGHFWTCYQDRFDDIIDFFGINKNSRNIVSRIDYAIDFEWPEVKDFVSYERESKKRESAENAMNLLSDFHFSEDGEFLMIPKSEMEKIGKIMNTTKKKKRNFGDRETYYGIGNERNELYIYDKKLDILDKEKYKLSINGEKPYLEILKEKSNITRIEYKKLSRSLREMEENSIYEILAKIEDMALDYMEDYYDLDFRYLARKERTEKMKLNKDRLVPGLIKKKAQLSLSMFKAYADRYITFKNEHDFFKEIYNLFWERLVNNIIKNHLEFPEGERFWNFRYENRKPLFVK